MDHKLHMAIKGDDLAGWNLQEFIGAAAQAEPPEGRSQQLRQAMWFKNPPLKHANGETENCRQIGFWHLYLWRYASIRKHLWVKLIHGLYMEGGKEAQMMKSL